MATKTYKTWQEELARKSSECWVRQLPDPIYNVVSAQRAGRMAWSTKVTIQGQDYYARYFYDGQFLNNAKEDAAEVACTKLRTSSTTESRNLLRPQAQSQRTRRDLDFLHLAYEDPIYEPLERHDDQIVVQIGDTLTHDNIETTFENVESTLPTDQSRHLLAAEKHLEACFVANLAVVKILKKLSSDALGDSGLEQGLTPHLNAFFIELAKDANEDLQRATAELLCIPWVYERMSHAIIRRIGHDTRPLAAWLDEIPTQERLSGKPLLQSSGWLMKHPNFEATADILARMSVFVFRGGPFQRFLDKIHLLTISPACFDALRALKTIPKQKVHFDYGRPTSWVESARNLLERRSTLKWNWWPLPPPRKATHFGHCRMHWSCHCGIEHYIDIPEQAAKFLQRMIEVRVTRLSQDHACIGRSMKRREWHRNLPSRLARFLVLSAAAKSHGTGSQPTSPPKAHLSHSTPVSGRISPTHQATASSGSSRGTSPGNVGSVRSSSIGSGNAIVKHERLVVLGIPMKVLRIKHANLRKLVVEDDPGLVTALTTVHEMRRGRLRAWVSPHQLASCTFQKFERSRKGHFRRESDGHPTDDLDYEYEVGTRHPPSGAKHPLVATSEFYDYFHTCPTPCFRWLWPLHECNDEPEKGEKWLWNRIPKKRSYWQINADTAWGLQCIYEISFLHVLVWYLLLVLGFGGFGIWWLIEHPDDIQTALAPMGGILGFVSAFWAGLGVMSLGTGQYV